MNVTGFARACGTAAAIAGAASVAGWARRPTIQWTGRTDQELSRLDMEFQTCLRTQLETARRYDHRFTLTSTQLDGGDPALVATACERHIRVLDAVTLTDGVLLFLWSSIERAEAATALDRLIAKGVLPPSSLARTGAATFPVDGFTAVSLIEAAAERVGTLQLPSRRELPRLHAVAAVPSSVRVEAGHTNGDGLAAVGG